MGMAQRASKRKSDPSPYIVREVPIAWPHFSDIIHDMDDICFSPEEKIHNYPGSHCQVSPRSRLRNRPPR